MQQRHVAIRISIGGNLSAGINMSSGQGQSAERIISGNNFQYRTSDVVGYGFVAIFEFFLFI